MKQAILTAAAMAFGVLMLFTGLVIGSRTVAVDQNSAREPKAAEVEGPAPVPSLDQIAEDKAAAEKLAQSGPIHSKAPIPKVKIFQTSYKAGTQVVFNHAQHVEKYKLQCIDCHHVERCSKCHLEGGTHAMEVVKSKQAMHENCVTCHSETSGPEGCADCHKQ